MTDLPEAESRIPEAPPRIPIKFEQFFAAMAMALLCCITFANVVARYLTNYSFAFTEEYSVFLMVVLTFFGSAAAFAANRHIRMTFLVDRLPVRLARPVEYLILVLSVVMFGMLVWYGAWITWDDYEFETTSPGLGVPQWWYTIWLPILSALIVARILGRIWRIARAAR
ncbi:MAG TPA: TRAP transporter small permease [Alphaproteobacteria bacterium]